MFPSIRFGFCDFAKKHAMWFKLISWGLWRRVSVTRSVSQSGEVAENVTGQLFQPCLVEVLWHQSIMLPRMAGMPRSAPGASLLRSSSRCERSVGKEIAPGLAHLSTYVRGEGS